MSDSIIKVVKATGGNWWNVEANGVPVECGFTKKWQAEDMADSYKRLLYNK